MVMKHFVSGVFFSSWISQKSVEEATATRMLPLCLAGKESLLMLRVGVRSVYALVRTPAYMCTQAGLRCSCVDRLQMMKTVFTTVFRIIFLGMMPIFCFESYCTINIKLTWMWNFRQTQYEYTKPGSYSWSMKQLQAVYQHVITQLSSLLVECSAHYNLPEFLKNQKSNSLSLNVRK